MAPAESAAADSWRDDIVSPEELAAFEATLAEMSANARLPDGLRKSYQDPAQEEVAQEAMRTYLEMADEMEALQSAPPAPGPSSSAARAAAGAGAAAGSGAGGADRGVAAEEKRQREFAEALAIVGAATAGDADPEAATGGGSARVRQALQTLTSHVRANLEARAAAARHASHARQTKEDLAQGLPRSHASTGAGAAARASARTNGAAPGPRKVSVRVWCPTAVSSSFFPRRGL